MYMKQAALVTVPDDIEKAIEEANGVFASVDTVKQELNRLSGLPDYELDAENPESYAAKPGFRDLLAFNFQPQNIVANPTTLFFRTDMSEYRERLKNIFPYALGAIDAALLEDQWKLAHLRKILFAKQRELNDEAEVIDRWKDEAQAWLTASLERGLITEDEHKGALTWDAILKLLKTIGQRTELDRSITSEGLNEANKSLLKLDKDEDELRYKLGLLSNRERELQKIVDAYKPYMDSLTLQKERLSISTWLRTVSNPANQNLLLGEQQKFGAVVIDELCLALTTIEADIEDIQPYHQQVEKRLVKVNEDKKVVFQRLSDLQSRRQSFLVENQELRAKRYQALEISRFVGGLSKVAEIYERHSASTGIAEEVRVLKKEIEDIEKRIRLKNVNEAINSALTDAESNGHTMLKGLDVEHPERTINLDIKDLAVLINHDERQDYLWEIGSGANWLSYHLAVIFGLQLFFVDGDTSPVPSFVILDQPTQVYFPSMKKSKDKEGNDIYSLDNNEDIKGVAMLFKTLSSLIKLTKGQLQIIVLDHADEDIWGKYPDIHKAARWRDHVKLIPKEWR